MNIDLIQILITVLAIVGVKSLTDSGSIFGFISDILVVAGENRFSLADPLRECLFCMASLYGLIGYLIQNPQNLIYSKFLILLLIALILSTLSEIYFSNGFYLKGIRSFYMALKYFNIISKFLYLSTIVIFIYINAIYSAFLFILVVAGLCTIIGAFFKSVLNNQD